MPSDPRHGEERNRRTERGWTSVEGRTPDGKPIGIPMGHGHTETVSERWCAACGRWIEVRGILQAIAFEFEHKEGHEPRTAA